MDYLEQLQQVRSETLQFFDLPAKDLEKTYGPGKWSVRFVLNHLADSETVFFYRIRRVISEPKQVIWVYDQEAWARALDYQSVPLELARSVYDVSRQGVMHYARTHYAGSDAISFVHSETGLRTLKDEFDKVVWHNQNHIQQIIQALA